MYCINVDIPTGTIEVEVGGFWSVEQVDAFAADLHRAITAVHDAGKSHRILYDYSTAAIQSQAVIAALQALARGITTPAVRIALYTGGRFARLQASRIATVRDNIRLFDDRADAMAWLMGDEQAPGQQHDAGPHRIAAH